MQSVPASLIFQDGRLASVPRDFASIVPRDLAPVFGLVCAVAASTVLWALPIGAWLLLR